MNSLKVGKLHILRLFPPGHLLYLTKRCWLDFVRAQSLNYEFRSINEARLTKSSFFLLKLRLSFYVSQTVKTTPPPQRLDLFLDRSSPNLHTKAVTLILPVYHSLASSTGAAPAISSVTGWRICLFFFKDIPQAAIAACFKKGSKNYAFPIW